MTASAALRLSGRFIVTIRTGPSTVTSRASNFSHAVGLVHSELLAIARMS